MSTIHMIHHARNDVRFYEEGKLLVTSHQEHITKRLVNWFTKRGYKIKGDIEVISDESLYKPFKAIGRTGPQSGY